MDSSSSAARDLQRRFHQVIPGGSHTYAKGDDQFPEDPPIYIVRGEGCHIWDTEGREYIEYGMGLRAVGLGHAYAPVVEAAARQMRLGSNFNRPSPLELECAEALLSLLPAADMVKFAKNGSDVNDAALKLARAYTGRTLVATCRTQPFFSIGDWFIGTTPMNAGIPPAVSGLTVGFRYNDLESAAEMFRQYPQQIAAVILEAEKDTPPVPGFLSGLRELCHREGALLILDEMITGFRWHNGGAQAYHDLRPDLSTFGKALGNGFSIAALAGRREIMRLGGAGHDQPRVFLLSTTHGAETHALAATLEVIRTYQREPVVSTMWMQGKKLADGLAHIVAQLNLAGHFTISGKPCCLTFGTCDAEKKPSQGFRTLLLQELLKRSILAPSLVISYAHTDADITKTLEAFQSALAVYRSALKEGLGKYLVGRPVQPVFRKYN